MPKLTTLLELLRYGCLGSKTSEGYFNINLHLFLTGDGNAS